MWNETSQTYDDNGSSLTLALTVHARPMENRILKHGSCETDRRCGLFSLVPVAGTISGSSGSKLTLNNNKINNQTIIIII